MKKGVCLTIVSLLLVSFFSFALVAASEPASAQVFPKKIFTMQSFLEQFGIIKVTQAIPSSCDSTNDLIMKLSVQNNALGTVWNGAASASVALCYSKIFLGAPSPGANPHDCKVGFSNRVVILTNANNGMAAGPH